MFWVETIFEGEQGGGMYRESGCVLLYGPMNPLRDWYKCAPYIKRDGEEEEGGRVVGGSLLVAPATRLMASPSNHNQHIYFAADGPAPDPAAALFERQFIKWRDLHAEPSSNCFPCSSSRPTDWSPRIERENYKE